MLYFGLIGGGEVEAHKSPYDGHTWPLRMFTLHVLPVEVPSVSI